MRWSKPLYSKGESLEKRAKKARKTLAKLVEKDPILREIVEKKARSMGLAMAQRQGTNKPAFKSPPAYKPGMGSAFYQTREWREVRYKVFVQHGKTCQCCGSREGHMHVDHIKPRSLFPELELDKNNLQVLCESCNIGKSNTDQTDWRQT